MARRDERSWLQQKFVEFFLEVQRQKEAIRSGRWAYYPDAPGGQTAGPGDPAAPNPAWQSIAALLCRQAEEAAKSGVAGEQLYRKAQFAMAVYADEVFTVVMEDWPGQDAWRENPLQKSFFNTIDGGREVFTEYIDPLIASYNPAEKDLAEVYFNVLTLGLRGMYGGRRSAIAGSVPPAEIEQRRRRLFHSFAEKPPVSSRASEQPYKHIRTEEAGGTIPSPTQSLAFLAIVVVVLCLSVWIAGMWLRGDMNATLEKLESHVNSVSQPTGGE